MLRLRDGKFIVAGEPEGLPADLTWSITPRKAGGLWVGSNGGVSRYLDGGFEPVVVAPRYGNVRVRALVEDAHGALWVGTEGKGLYRLQEGELQAFDQHSGLSGDAVTALFVDAHDVLWVGTNNGLDRIVDGRVTAMTELLPGAGRDAVHLLAADHAGRLWVGTETHGVFIIDGAKVKHLGMADGLPSEWVLALHEDAQGVMWLGTTDGLAAWRDGRILSFAPLGGTLRETILELLEDDLHTLWFSTNKGLVAATRADLDALLAGATPPTLRVYGLADGLRSAEFVGGNTSPGCRTADGLLWFASIRGLVRVDPQHLHRDRGPPPVRLERVVVDGAALPVTDALQVRPGRHQWEFRYTALDLLVPQRTHFKYRMEGFDVDWIDAGERRTAYYTQLPPGSYTFQVIAANEDGIWNLGGARLHFTLQPYFYQTWWFALLCLLSVAAGIRTWHRLRVGRLRRSAAYLRGQVAVRTRDLLAANRELLLAKERA